MTDGSWRVSLRFEGQRDVRAIASQFGGGGHVNAAGCTARGEIPALRDTFMQMLVRATGESVQDRQRPRIYNWSYITCGRCLSRRLDVFGLSATWATPWPAVSPENVTLS